MITKSLKMSSFLASFVILVLAHAGYASVTFPVIGDWGPPPSSSSRVRYQRETASVMDRWCGGVGCQFIVSTGDNFYVEGVTSSRSSRFDVSWARVYTGSNIRDLTWYQSVGNHDHWTEDGRERFQVEYSRDVNSKWQQPDLYYSFSKTDGNTRVDFFVLDTQSIRKNKNDYQAQLSWFERELSQSTATWKVVIAHHPPYSAGNYGPGSGTIRSRVVPIMERYGADVLFLGHDHNLQHINKSGGTGIDYVVSGGGGGSGLYSEKPSAVSDLEGRGYRVRHFTRQYGFVGVDADSSRMKMEFYDRYNNRVYVYRRYK